MYLIKDKELLQCNNKRKTTQLKSRQRILIDIFPKKIYKWPISTWKDVWYHYLLGKWKSKLQWDTTLNAKAETPVLWPPHVKSWLIWKDPDAGRDWGQEKKGTTEDEMAGWHHRLDGHEFEWTPGVGDGQGGLACCDSWGCKESDTTERLNWTERWL